MIVEGVFLFKRPLRPVLDLKVYRFHEHIAGKVTSSRSRGPLKLIYYEAYLLEADAKGRERFLKSGSGKHYVRKQLKHFFQNQS